MQTHPQINAKKVQLGINVVIEETALIRGTDGTADEIIIGDNTYIGHFVQIICNQFSIGDYGKIHHHTNIHGYMPCVVGHNAWIGQHCIIDSIGQTTIGNNCGIGAYSQLWSHIKYGDTLEGCRFFAQKNLNIGNDVWFVGHCIVSPITAHDKSMALVGTVITHDMKYNTIYAGCPAQEMTHKLGCQFQTVAIDTKMQLMQQYLRESGVNSENIVIVHTMDDFKDDHKTYFALEQRCYTKRQTLDEIKFMHYLLPHRGKFVPA